MIGYMIKINEKVFDWDIKKNLINEVYKYGGVF